MPKVLRRNLPRPLYAHLLERKVFSDAQTVNDSLRALAGIIRQQKSMAK